MAPASNVVASPLVDPVGVADDTELAEECCTTGVTAAHTSIGRKVEFQLKKINMGTGRSIVFLRLYTNNLETPDPYGGDPIPSFPEVVCTHENSILLRLRSPSRHFPTDYFVYGCSTSSRQSTWVHRLPEIEPEIRSARSVGILRVDDDYVVANLRQVVDPRTWELAMFLDCYSSRNQQKEWNQKKVTLPFPTELEVKYISEWRNDRVIPFRDSLLWVDLTRGILRCRNLFRIGSGDQANFQYVPLPPCLLPAQPADDHSFERPELSRSVCCNNGELKLVTLHSVHDGHAGKVAVWTLDWSQLKWKEEKNKTLDYPCLLDGLKHLLPHWVDSPPCFPVLSMDNADILYVTVAGENKAWLLEIDIQTSTLNNIAEYSSFCNYMNPPYPSNLSMYLNNKPVDDPCSDNPVPTHQNLQPTPYTHQHLQRMMSRLKLPNGPITRSHAKMFMLPKREWRKLRAVTILIFSTNSHSRDN